LGIALENQDGKETLYFIENICYQTPWLGAIEEKIGAGRLSRVVLETGQALQRDLITCKSEPSRVGANLKSCEMLWLEYKNYHKAETLAKLHDLYGLLNWPNSLIIEKPRSSLLVTEARGLSRVNLKSGEIQYLYSFPLCFNLNDLCMENKDSLLLLDSGVAGKDSYGRLFRINKKSGKIKNFIVEGINRAEGFKVNPEGKSVFLSQNHPYPYGRVCEIRLSDGKELRCWRGLDEPRAIAISLDATYALVTSKRGLYKLTL
jgi:hypothetical protein